MHPSTLHHIFEILYKLIMHIHLRYYTIMRKCTPCMYVPMVTLHATLFATPIHRSESSLKRAPPTDQILEADGKPLSRKTKRNVPGPQNWVSEGDGSNIQTLPPKTDTGTCHAVCQRIVCCHSDCWASNQGGDQNILRVAQFSPKIQISQISRDLPRKMSLFFQFPSR